MSKVTELFSQAGVENAELVASIEQLVETAESKNTGIPTSRFNEVIHERNDLRADLTEKESEIESFNEKVEKLTTKLDEAKDYKTRLKEFQQEKHKQNLNNWLEKAKLFDVDEEDKSYDKINKIKDDFTFKDDDDEYTEEEIAQNLKMLKPYEKINYFGSKHKEPEIDDKRGKRGKQDKFEDPLDDFDN